MKDEHQKGDISIGLTMGTFLSGLDTGIAPPLTLGVAQGYSGSPPRGSWKAIPLKLKFEKERT